MNVFTRHPVDSPVITQPWGANRTGGITPDPNGTDMQRIVATYGNYQPHGHDGIDYGCPIGTPVYAPGDGVVDYAGWGQDMPQWVADKYASVAGPGGWPSGIITFLDHGPIGSYVAHKSESYMDNRVGERIAAGTLLGLSGTTGRSGGPHVHFSAIKFPVNYSDPLYSRVNPLDHFSTVTLTPIRPGATGGSAVSKPGTIEPTPTPKEWHEMPIPAEDLKKIHDAIWHGVPGAKLINNRDTKKGEWAETTLGSLTDRIVRQQIAPLRQEVAVSNAQIKGLVGAIAALSKGEPFDEAKLLAGVQAAAKEGALDGISEGINSIDITLNTKGDAA